MSIRRAWWRVVVVLALLGLGTLACSLSSDNADDGASVDVATAPLVLLLAPENNSTIAEGAAVEFYALAQDIQGQVARLEFRVDDKPLADAVLTSAGDQMTVYGTLTWTAAGQSKHIVTVEAFRADGASLGFVDRVVTVVQTPLAGVVTGSPSVNLNGAQPQPQSQPQATSVPTPTAASSAPPQTDLGIFSGPTALVMVAELNIRQGPDTAYPPVGTLKKGDRVQIVGRNGDSSWWAVAFSGGTAWVFAELVTLDGDVSTVPLVASP